MIKSYVKSRWLVLLVMVWGIVIFTAVDAVTPKRESHILYAVFLFILVDIIAIGVDFILYYKKAAKLHMICTKENLLQSALDMGDDIIDVRYREIFAKLQAQTNEAVWKLSENYSNQIDYYSMWVHQIKTPISALRLMIQSDDKIQSKGGYYAELFRIEQYVEMVLQYLRLQNVSEDTVVSKVDVYPLIRESVKKFSPIFINRHIGVDIRYFDQMVYTDEKWLVFMIEQFLSNSLKYSNSGTIHFFGKKEGKNWVLCIRDEGIGIRSEDIPRIFEKGYTGYNGRIYKKSTGIGLYLVNGAARRLGIGLQVESTEGKGTTVKMIFPEDILC